LKNHTVGLLFVVELLGFPNGSNWLPPSHIRFAVVTLNRFRARKKADVAEYLKVLGHVGLLFNEPPSLAEVPFI
jgi:hypothetical protein